MALLIETSNAYARGLLEGIVEYQREHDRWSVFLPEQERGASPPAWLAKTPLDGVIARIETAAIARAVSRLKVPVVDVSSARRVSHIPWIETDDSAIARLAFDHLVERGFRSFAFCGPKGLNWSQWRREHFVACCEQAGFSCDSFLTPSPYRKVETTQTTEKLSHWLEALPKPLGMFCSYDIQAQVVLDRCRTLELAVPEQIAVIGVDNDPLLCDLSRPSLTSIAPDARGAGYFAAQWLDQVMESDKRLRRDSNLSVPTKLMPPLGIVPRQSTDILAVEDPTVAKAIQFIRAHACDGIQVTDVLQHVAMSRRMLETRFTQATGKTPHEMISEARLSRVKELLQQTELPIEAIAERAGFEHSEYMSVAFRKAFGVPPGRYRRQVVK
ncbi:MAG: DNA-binding transcriptional regulator [Planctomycetes bacterium]|nr:DNA-binding transcriptional regulator [Planctomycetota bacterium]